MFSALASKYSSILKREIKQKLLFYNCGSAGWLTEYWIAKDSKPWGVYVLLITVLWEFNMDLVVLAIFAESFFSSFKNIYERAKSLVLLSSICSAQVGLLTNAWIQSA